MSLRVRCMAALQEIAAKGHCAKHKEPTAGTEVPGLHGDIVQKATMLPVTHHVVTKNSIQ